MLATALGMILILGQDATGTHGPKKPAARCESCGAGAAALDAEARTLRESPRWRARDRAARALREADWKCHPDAVLALCDALAKDRDPRVREEAAGSLRRMAPRVPVVHEALERATTSDPVGDVRKQARKAIEALGKRCVADCRICGPLPTGSVIHGPTIIPPGWMPWIAPDPAPSSPAPARDGPSPGGLPPAIPDEASPRGEATPPPPGGPRLGAGG